MRAFHRIAACLIAAAFFCQASAIMAQAPKLVQSTQSGRWSATATWEGGKIPSAGVQVLVKKGHTVTYDVQSQDVIRSLHISGVLTFAPDRDTLLEVGLIKIQHGDIVDESGFDCAAHKEDATIKTKGSDAGLNTYCLCCEGKPSLLVGTPERHIDVGKTAKIRLHYIDGMDKESCPAIVNCGGRMDFHGAPMSRTWVRLGADVMTRKNTVSEITLAEPVTGWRVGDQIIVTTSGMANYKQSGTEETTIKSIDGIRITLQQPLTQSHSGSGDYRSEVANLSRNVIVESADPDGLRGHTMYHRQSSGSISFAEFRHLGKEGVLGRYSIHYHLCGDTMRGSSVVGASIHHSKNRWITIHGASYLVVRDCVGYKSVGHGYFLEDGTEVYNVLDRNLACQAVAGKPLPDQMLPFDKNDGAGFWWANSHNTFTRNVAVECGRYGFRFDAQPKAGAIVGKEKFGDPKKEFSLVMPIRQPNGSAKPTDLRTLPFVRFEDNETHGNEFWGLNLGQHAGGKIGPDASTPFVIRNMRIWDVTGGFGVEVPNVQIDGMTVSRATYATRESQYVAQDYRNVTLYAQKTPLATLDQYLALKSANGTARARQPGWPKGNGDGGPKVQAPEVEVAKLKPIDKLPPQTIITSFQKIADGKLWIRGTTADNGAVSKVVVNGRQAKATAANFSEWEVVLDQMQPGNITISAHAEDNAGNVEQTRHRVTVVVRSPDSAQGVAPRSIFMATLFRTSACSLSLAMLALLSADVSAYITVDMPLVKIYNSADALYVAKVKSVEMPQQRMIITLDRVLRQDRKKSAAAPPAEDFALQLDEPKDLLKQVVKGMPVVIFVGKQAAAIHLADEWLIAQQATPRAWRVHGKHELTSSFPGRTAALVKIVESLHKKQPVLTKSRDSYTAQQLKDLGDPLLDMFEHSNWGAFHSLGKLGVNATHMIAGDVSGDKKPDVLIATSKGVRFYLGGGSAAPVTDATKEWGLTNALASQAAFGDVDGDSKLDLLLDAMLWLNTGSSFVEAKKALTPLENGQPLALALADINDDKKLDALVLHKDGRLQVFENAGRTDQPWKMQVRQLWSKDESPLAAHFGPFGDNGKLHVLVIWPNDIVRFGLHDDSGPPMDYRRLTGRSREARYFPIKDFAASAPIDLNGGDGRLDLFIATRQGKPRDICLMNRGHGAFWPNNEAGRPKGLVKKNVFPAAMTAADMRGSGSWEMLVLTSTGELFQVDSPPYKKGKPAK